MYTGFFDGFYTTFVWYFDSFASIMYSNITHQTATTSIGRSFTLHVPNEFVCMNMETKKLKSINL